MNYAFTTAFVLLLLPFVAANAYDAEKFSQQYEQLN